MLLKRAFCWTPIVPSLLKLLCSKEGPIDAGPTPIPSPAVGPNLDKGESVVLNCLWRSIEPVGLRRRVGLLLEGGELMLSGGSRFIGVLGSSPPVKELDDEFKRKDKRSKRDPGGSVPVLTSLNSFRSTKGPVSGNELARKRERWAFALSGDWSTDVDL